MSDVMMAKVHRQLKLKQQVYDLGLTNITIGLVCGECGNIWSVKFKNGRARGGWEICRECHPPKVGADR